MKRTLRIAIADDEQATRDYLRELLTGLGHQLGVQFGILGHGGFQSAVCLG